MLGVEFLVHFSFSFLIALHSHRKAEMFELPWQTRKDRTQCQKKKKNSQVLVKHFNIGKSNLKASFTHLVRILNCFGVVGLCI